MPVILTNQKLGNILNDNNHYPPRQRALKRTPAAETISRERLANQRMTNGAYKLHWSNFSFSFLFLHRSGKL